MDQCTHEVRLKYWTEIIAQCHARPEGQTAQQWLKENGICSQSYYIWQKKIRQMAYDVMHEEQSSLPAPIEQTQSQVSFAEVPFSIQNNNPQKISGPIPVKPVAVIQTAHYSVALTADIPETFLIRILQEASHA